MSQRGALGHSDRNPRGGKVLCSLGSSYWEPFGGKTRSPGKERKRSAQVNRDDGLRDTSCEVTVESAVGGDQNRTEEVGKKAKEPCHGSQQ